MTNFTTVPNRRMNSTLPEQHWRLCIFNKAGRHLEITSPVTLTIVKGSRWIFEWCETLMAVLWLFQIYSKTPFGQTGQLTVHKYWNRLCNCIGALRTLLWGSVLCWPNRTLVLQWSQFNDYRTHRYFSADWFSFGKMVFIRPHGVCKCVCVCVCVHISADMSIQRVTLHTGLHTSLITQTYSNDSAISETANQMHCRAKSKRWNEPFMRLRLFTTNWAIQIISIFFM